MRWQLAALVLLALPACRGAPAEPEPGTAAGGVNPARRPRLELVETLQDDLARPRHPADGGGRAFLEAIDGESAAAAGPVTAGGVARFTLVYEAGPLGIAVGGALFLQPSPFWGWSTPQVVEPQAPGYTEVSTAAAGVILEPATLDRQLLGITVGGRALMPGERVRIVYGAGPAGAQVDRFAEHGSRLWLAVDGDGDGVRQVLADSPAVDVAAGPPARLLLTLPSTARPGDSVRLTVAVLDAEGNAGVPWAGEVALAEVREPGEEGGPEVELPARVHLAPADGGHTAVEVAVRGSGVVRLRGTAGGLTAESNPLQLSPAGARILWGDLQCHSGYSDGSGSPEDHFRYARDIAALDVYALTDHDHWGVLFLDRQPEMWREVNELTARYYAPGRFVTVFGYEWTSWIHGHRHVLYFDGPGPLYSTLDPAYASPRQLWAALRGRRALTVAHHTAGGPIATDWSIPPDPALEPVTEVVSVHGSSEAADSPGVIYSAVPGNFARDALDRGYRLGFIGSGDGHDGHPGLAHLASPTGGLAAILAEEATREAVYAALRARRVYATSGPRIILRATYGGYPMGADVPADGGAPPLAGVPASTLLVQALAPAALDRIDVVRSGGVAGTVDCGGERRCSFGLEVPRPRAGEYLYVRAVQRDGGAAWSSPFFFVAGGAPAGAAGAEAGDAAGAGRSESE